MKKFLVLLLCIVMILPTNLVSAKKSSSSNDLNIKKSKKGTYYLNQPIDIFIGDKKFTLFESTYGDIYDAFNKSKDFLLTKSSSFNLKRKTINPNGIITYESFNVNYGASFTKENDETFNVYIYDKQEPSNYIQLTFYCTLDSENNKIKCKDCILSHVHIYGLDDLFYIINDNFKLSNFNTKDKILNITNQFNINEENHKINIDYNNNEVSYIYFQIPSLYSDNDIFYRVSFKNNKSSYLDISI